MGAQTGAAVKDTLEKLFASVDTTTAGLVDTMLRRAYIWKKDAADAMASTASNVVLGTTQVQMKVISAKVLNEAALTSDNTNYATLSFQYDNANSGATTTIANVTTQNTLGGGSGSWTAYLPVSMTNQNIVIPAGSQIYATIVKTGSGVAVPASSLELVLEIY